MAIAGKVAITPKGEWNANTAYTKLDLVFYDNASYVAIQPSTGVEPTNTSYWMLVVQSAGGADLDGIINGDIQVGNAKTLDGHEADVFAKKVDLSNIDAKTLDGHEAEYFATKGEVFNGSILEKALTLEVGVYHYHFGTGNLSDLPNNYYRWGSATVYVRSKAAGVLVMLWGMEEATIHCPPTWNYYNSVSWSGWETPITARGGTVANSNVQPMFIQRNGNGNVFLGYKLYNELVGSFGFSAKDKPSYMSTDGQIKDLFHTGNKPTGTYTGNGSATERTINIGGIGEYVAIRKQSSKGVVIVSRSGYFGTDGTSFITGTDVVVDASGNLIVATINAVFNENGKTYEYTKL